MEALVAIGLTAVVLSVFTATTATSVFLRKSGYSIQASNFVREEIDALRVLPYTELIDRTNGSFLGLSLTRGTWQAKVVSGTPSGTQALALITPATTSLVSETGLAVVPSNYHADFDFTAKFNVLASSPAGWGTGIAFHYRDAENHYRFRFSSGGVALDKVYHGTATTLWTQSATYNTGTWYTLRIVTSGTSISLYKNGTLLTTQTDSTFTTGDIALQTLSNALVYVDDVSLTELSATTTWNFDADTAGAMPTSWQRFVYEDLPSGAGTVTIAGYNGQTDIKKVDVTVTWNDTGFTKTMTGSTLIAK
ncbi:MAG: hypothetical protein RLZZ324_1328 [Candidatus Parcubacteria bacterium]